MYIQYRLINNIDLVSAAVYYRIKYDL